MVVALAAAAGCSSGSAGRPDTSLGGSSTSGSAGATTGGFGGAGGSGATSGAGTLAGGGVGGTSGAGGAPPAKVKPVLRDGRWALDLGEVTLEVDPAQGARITTFRLGTENLLTGPDVHSTYWGSTLWTSPEAQWMHPPPGPIDSEPYTVQAGETAVTMTGATHEPLGVSVTKLFSADPLRGSFVIEYRLTNQQQSSIQMAPWEVTRVFPRGLTFFPTGSKMTFSPGATLPTSNAGGVTWYAYDMAAVTENSKMFADGTEGWVAHVAQNLVFIKKFPDVPPASIAPDEGDVELYTDGEHSYIEIENQGAYGPIAPGQSAAWKVEWFLRRLPAGMSATAGNAALVQFVRETID